MAKEPVNGTGISPVPAKPTLIPLSKIHSLPGVFIQAHPDKSYGGLVSSIQSGDVKEPVILRVREDGEYQLVHGYRRKRASELAQKQEIPALIYEMALQEAVGYFQRVRTQPTAPVPGKLIAHPEQAEKPGTSVEQPAPKADVKEKADADKTVEAVPPIKPGQEKDTSPSPAEKKQTQQNDKNVETAPAKEAKPQSIVEDKSRQAAPQADAKEKADADKTVKAAPPAKTEQDKGEPLSPAEEKPSGQPQQAAAVKDNIISMPAVSKADEKKEPLKAASGPAGTQITKVFDDRLSPPDEKALKDVPIPQEGELFFITLHPAYLKNSELNTISVDRSSENYQELRKSIERNGIKDPVLARISPDGALEIVSGQRRHMIASELNYFVPTIIQKIDDADAKIIVADGNLHRDKISTYDLSRALRMKMEGMKQKTGRRKKGSFTADEFNSDEKLAQEMGMSVSKLNRIIRLSEASKNVCDRVDDGSLALSIASAISFLTPAHQDDVLRLSDLGYKLTNERIERAKKAEKTGKLDEAALRGILDDKDIAPRQTVAAPLAAATAEPMPPPNKPQPAQAAPTSADVPPIPPSPDVQMIQPGTPLQQTQAPPAPIVEKPPSQEAESFKGKQERPEHTKVVLAGDRLRKYFPDVNMTPREIEESIYDALEERRQRQEKLKQKESLVKKGPVR